MLELDVTLSLDHFNLSAALALDSPMTAFFGPPGSGKSTLFGVIAGIVHPQRGWVKLGGETLLDTRQGIRVPAGRRRVGLVCRDPTVYPRYSVRTHLQLASGLSPFHDDALRCEEIIDLLELEHVLDCHSHQLSPAERQRVAVAHALMGSPRLLLLDDPASSSDDAAMVPLLPFLTRVQGHFGIPVIYVSHKLADALQQADQMVLMANGRILGAGAVHDVITDRILVASAILQGIENLLTVTILAHERENGCTTAYYYGAQLVLPFAPHFPRHASAQISIRSSDIALSKRYLEGISIQNQIKGRVCAIIRAPDHAVVQVDCGQTLLAGVSLRALREMGLQEGDSIYCLIKTHAFSYVGESLPNPAPRRAQACKPGIGRPKLEALTTTAAEGTSLFPMRPRALRTKH